MVIFYIMGRSGCGKDTIKHFLLKQDDFICSDLKEATTRPIRVGEDPDNKLFLSDEEFEKMVYDNKFIEVRSYEVKEQDKRWWSYATVFPDTNKKEAIYVGTGTIESYVALRNHYQKQGLDIVKPIFIDVSDYNLLYRSITREIGSETKKFMEICRRFNSDVLDYSEQNIKQAGISKHCRFDNNKPISEVITRIRAYVIRNSKMERDLQKANKI